MSECSGPGCTHPSHDEQIETIGRLGQEMIDRRDAIGGIGAPNSGYIFWHEREFVPVMLSSEETNARHWREKWNRIVRKEMRWKGV